MTNTLVNRPLFMTDIDGTLLHEGGVAGQPGLSELKQILSERAGRFVWGVATGRRLELVQRVFNEHDLPDPDFIVCSVGTEIYRDLSGALPDREWSHHLKHRWDASAVRSAASSVPGLTPQNPASQGIFKVSFQIQGDLFRLELLHQALGALLPDVNVIVTRNTHLDLLPRRASKWLAIQHLCQRWDLTEDHTVVAGDSGNDFDMLWHCPHAIVVGNHSTELDPLRSRAGAYFAAGHATLGILEGLSHFNFPSFTAGNR